MEQQIIQTNKTKLIKHKDKAKIESGILDPIPSKDKVAYSIPEKWCYVVACYGDEIYTNIDSLYPNRKKKAELFGLDAEFMKYRYKDIVWIEDLCDIMVLYYSKSKIAPSKYGFEEVYSGVKDTDKVYLSQPSLSTLPNERLDIFMVTNEETKRRAKTFAQWNMAQLKERYSTWKEDNDWVRLFIRSWLKLHPISQYLQRDKDWTRLDKTLPDVQRYRVSVTYNTYSYLITTDSNIGYYPNITNLGLIEIVYRYVEFIPDFLKKVYKASKGHITPAYSEVGHTGWHGIFIYDADTPKEDLDRAMEVIKTYWGPKTLLDVLSIKQPGENWEQKPIWAIQNGKLFR